MCSIIAKDETEDARNATPAEAQSQVDELMANEHKLWEPFSRDELAEIFEKRENPAEKSFLAEILYSGIRGSKQEIQSEIDSFIRYYRYFQSSLSREELYYLFQKHSWGQAHGWREYLLLTDEEKKIVDELNLTPRQKDFTPSPRSLEEQRSDLKLATEVKPEHGYRMNFTLTTFCVLRYDSEDGKSYYCAGDCTVYDKSRRENRIEADEYYLNRIKEELKESDDPVAAMWMHILSSPHFAVEKNELRPDQIEYFEEKVRNTLEKCRTARLEIDDWSSPEETYLKEQCELWKKFQLLTETEKQILEELNLTPEYPGPDAEKQNPDELSAEEQRSELKKQFSD